jgi:hypothetical protein
MTFNQIEKEFNKWLDAFGLSPTVIRWIEHGEDKETDDGTSVFEITQCYPYRVIEIQLFPYTFTLKPDELPRYVLHEIMHLVLWRLTNDRKELSDKLYLDAEEDVCDRVALVIHALIH